MHTQRITASRVAATGCLIAFLAVSPTGASQNAEVRRSGDDLQASKGLNSGTDKGRIQDAPTGQHVGSLKPLRIVELATGSAAEVRAFSSSASKSAVVHFTDPNLGSIEFLVDNQGTLWTDDGISVGGDVLEAAWKGYALPASGTAHLFRTVRGHSEVVTVNYGAEGPTRPALGAESQAPASSGLNPLLARFSEFAGHLRAASTKGGGTGRAPLASEFRIAGAAGATLEPEAALVPQDGFLDCLFCGVAILVYIAATIDLAACITIILCGFAIVSFIAAGYEVANYCGACI